MDTRGHFDDDGSLVGFQIENLFISRRQIRRLLNNSGLTTDAKLMDGVASKNPERLAFSLDGTDFLVQEPFGDSSVYWISPVDPSAEASNSIARIQAVFEGYRVPLLRLAIGSILSGAVIIRPFRAVFSWVKRWNSS
jgi:hypothetical protein